MKELFTIMDRLKFEFGEDAYMRVMNTKYGIEVAITIYIDGEMVRYAFTITHDEMNLFPVDAFNSKLELAIMELKRG